METLKAKIRHVPDFPKPGILFYDITTLLRDKEGFRQAVDSLTKPYLGEPIDLIVGIESRGFILARQSPIDLGPASCSCESQANCLRRRFRPVTSWSTAPIRSRCTRTPSVPASTCSSSTISLRRGVPREPSWSSSNAPGGSWTASRS